MRVVIIGGSGMIGKALTKELSDHGHEVTVLSRRQGAQTHWDGRDSGELTHLLQGQEAVVNLAGLSIGSGRWTEQRKAMILSSRLEPGQALAQAIAALAEKPKVVVQASAVGFYGTGDETMNETSPLGQDWLAEVCRQWEQSVAGIAAAGVRLVTIRSGIVLSGQGGVLSQFTLPMRFFVGGPLGSGKQWTSWIHLQDEVRAIRFLLERPDCNGVYNLTAPDPIRNWQMEKTLARVMHRPCWLPLPAVALRLALGEMSTLVLEGQNVLPVRLLQAGFKFDFPNLEPALRDLLN
jgi:TIGR01777 family protein